MKIKIRNFGNIAKYKLGDLVQDNENLYWVIIGIIENDICNCDSRYGNTMLDDVRKFRWYNKNCEPIYVLAAPDTFWRYITESELKLYEN